MVRFERLGEEVVEILRLFAGDEKHAGGAAMLETVEAG